MEKEVTNQDTAGKVQNKVQCPDKERSPDEHSAPMGEKRSEADAEDHGDCKQESEKKEKPATIKETNSDASHTRTQEASETTISPTQDDKKDDQIDGLITAKNEEISATDDTACQSGDEVSEGKTQSTNRNQDGFCEENLDSDRAHSQEHAVTAAAASSSQRADFSDTTRNGDSPEKEVQSVAEGRSPDKDSTHMEKKSDLSQAHGKQSSPKYATPVTIQEAKSDEGHITKNEASELNISQIVNEEKDDQVSEPKSELNDETSATTSSDNQSGGEVDHLQVDHLQVDAPEETQDKRESTTQDKQQLEDRSNDVETIGPITPEATQPEVTGGSGKYLIAVAVVALVAIMVQRFLQPESPPQTNDVRQIDVFLRKLEKVKTRFPNQRAELWNRSRIHLKRHLQTAHPTEPVSLILTAGLRAEKTLNCLARDLASAFSSALNASVLHIDGASKASQDSDQVKLDIDRKLQGAFEGDKPVAVIHRFEELPPGSTLIFYRYCDHENAAYKKTFLIFTVLLGEEDEIPAKISLCAVEEMVDDHLQTKFLTHGHPVSFDMMDLDKYSGLWSRISHLILPVAAEERMELEGCQWAEAV